MKSQAPNEIERNRANLAERFAREATPLQPPKQAKRAEAISKNATKPTKLIAKKKSTTTDTQPLQQSLLKNNKDDTTPPGQSSNLTAAKMTTPAEPNILYEEDTEPGEEQKDKNVNPDSYISTPVSSLKETQRNQAPQYDATKTEG